jgi:hypothetical protein
VFLFSNAIELFGVPLFFVVKNVLVPLLRPIGFLGMLDNTMVVCSSRMATFLKVAKTMHVVSHI